VVSLSPVAAAWPTAVPSPSTAPFTVAVDVVSSSVKVDVALADAEAPGPLPLTFTSAEALPLSTEDPLSESREVSVPSEPSASAPAEDDALDPPELALDPALELADAPAPFALAPALELELADPPPAEPDEWLSADALADAASAFTGLNWIWLISGTNGAAIMTSARALAETMSPNLKLLGRCMGILLNSCENGIPCGTHRAAAPACLGTTGTSEDWLGWRLFRIHR
jgi:hypothetical protein